MSDFGPGALASFSGSMPTVAGRCATCCLRRILQLPKSSRDPHGCLLPCDLPSHELPFLGSGAERSEVALGVTSRTSDQAGPVLLRINRGHWSIENSCHHVLDMTWDEDRCRIRTGHGPETASRLRRFAISVLNLHAKPDDSIASLTHRLAAKTRLVFDYLTANATGHAAAA